MAREADEASIARARVQFEALTGPFSAGEAWYEERISAFFDYALASFEAGALVRAFAARADVTDEERAIARAIKRAERSVYRVERSGEGLVIGSLYGARYRIARSGVAARFEGGERFDGRIVSIGGAIEIMPGAVFHPAETHDAMDRLLAEIAEKAPTARSQEQIADAVGKERSSVTNFLRLLKLHHRQCA